MLLTKQCAPQEPVYCFGEIQRYNGVSRNFLPFVFLSPF